MNDHPERQKFADLDLDTVFEFYSKIDFPYSGMMQGPWRKTGLRTYCKVADRTFQCEVGTINVDVYTI